MSSGQRYSSPFSGLPRSKPASRVDNDPSHMGHPVPAGPKNCFGSNWMAGSFGKGKYTI